MKSHILYGMSDIDTLENLAIDAAVKSNWEKAVELNNEILAIEEHNVAAHLRAGYAYMQLKKMEKSYTHYKKALSLQPGNTIAQENMEKVQILKMKGAIKKNNGISAKINPNQFLEVPGKTKTVSLVNLGQRNALAQLVVGQDIEIKARRHKIELRTAAKEYIGSLPDDLSRRLLAFIDAGSEYEVFIKESSLNRVVVFIRELKKGKKVSMYLSFPQNVQQNIANLQNTEESDENEEDTDDEKDHIEMMAEALKDEDDLPQFSSDDDEDDDTEE